MLVGVPFPTHPTSLICTKFIRDVFGVKRENLGHFDTGLSIGGTTATNLKRTCAGTQKRLGRFS